MRTFPLVALVLFSTAFASCTSITVEPLSAELQVQEICIQNNPKVIVEDFLLVIQEGLARHGIKATLHTGSVPAECEYLMTYTARQSWDGVPYLSHAEILIEHKGARVGYGEYHLIGKAAFSLLKWQSTNIKMDPVLDELFEEYLQEQP